MCTYTCEYGEASAHCSSYNQYADAFQVLQIPIFPFNNNNDNNHASTPINLLGFNFVYVFELNFPVFESSTVAMFLNNKMYVRVRMLRISIFFHNLPPIHHAPSYVFFLGEDSY